MEFMYCIPDLEVFIDSTIKKCLLEYDLERDDTESVLDDIEKVMVRPTDDENGYYEKSYKDVNHNTQKSRQAYLDPNRIKDLSTVLGDLQKLNAIGKMKMSKEDVIASLVKDKRRRLDLPGAVLDHSKRSDSVQSEQSSAEEGGDNSRCPSRESKSSTPDISDSPKLPTKLKSRLQQRYFQNSREPSPELMKDTEDHNPRSPISPDSGHVTSSGFECDHSLSPSPTERNARKRSASGDGDEDSLGQKRPDLEQPPGKIPRLIECPHSPNSTSSHKQTSKEADTSLFDLYCLAFRSSADGSVPIETLNRSMHVPMLLKGKLDNMSSAQNKQGNTEARETHSTARNACSLSTSPIGNAPQQTQKHTIQCQKTNNAHQRFQLLKQRLQQRNQRLNNRDMNSTHLTSNHQQQGLRKRRPFAKSFQEEFAAAEKFFGHTTLISDIIAEELMKADDKEVPKSTSPCDVSKANTSLPRYCNGTSSSSMDVHTTDVGTTVQSQMPTLTPSSQAPPLIAVTSWQSPPPLIQHPLDASMHKAVPLRAHQIHVSSSTVCVIPESSICLTAFPSPPIDHYDDNVPQDLSQKSSRRKVEEE